MKKIYSITVIVFAMALLSTVAAAQRKTPVRKPTPRPTPMTLAAAEVRDAKTKASNQEYNVSRFTVILSSVASSIEATDRESKSRTLDKKVLDANSANKQKLLTAIRGLRTALTSLETEFKTKPSLRRFSPRLEGITALSTQSEDLAYAGKFMQSKAPLDTVAQKLRETVALMP
jgi:hypothetical protein